MINFSDYIIFGHNLSNLKETSIDKRDSNNIKYMTDSEYKAINFDNVKNAYVKDLNLSVNPKSNDALFINKNNQLVFVEFKNGFMDNGKKFAVRKKIYDSIIILTDILNVGISKLRDNMEYILVYNENVNSNEYEVNEKNKYIQSSKSYDNFAKNLGKLANDEYVCFGIKMFKNYCFKDVHTYTEKEFEEYLRNNT